MANCFCCLSQNAMVCFAHCRQELQQKSWKTARLFLQDQDQNVQDQPRLHDPRPRLSFLSSRRLETKTLVSNTTSLVTPVLNQCTYTLFIWRATMLPSWCTVRQLGAQQQIWRGWTHSCDDANARPIVTMIYRQSNNIWRYTFSQYNKQHLFTWKTKLFW